MKWKELNCYHCWFKAICDIPWYGVGEEERKRICKDFLKKIKKKITSTELPPTKTDKE